MIKVIPVPSAVLELLIDMARSHVDDITSGIQEGLYAAKENDNIGDKEQAVAAAEALYQACMSPQARVGSANWQDVAASLAGALDSCTTQIEQMKGMFGDDDGNIQQALDDADQAMDRYDGARAAADIGGESVRDQLAIWLAIQSAKPGATLLQCVGRVAPCAGPVRTGVTVVAFHGSIGPIEATAEGAIAPDGTVFIAGPFSYGSEQTDTDLGEDQLDITLVRFPDGAEENLLANVGEVASARIHDATVLAQEAFWAKFAAQFPEITSGDFPPDATVAFDEACIKAASVWVEGNRP